MNFKKKLLTLLSFLMMSVFLLTGCSPEEVPAEETNEAFINEDGTYTSKEEVAEYIYLYNHLPSNFITKKRS